jgi:hypothetical protein
MIVLLMSMVEQACNPSSQENAAGGLQGQHGLYSEACPRKEQNRRKQGRDGGWIGGRKEGMEGWREEVREGGRERGRKEMM